MGDELLNKKKDINSAIVCYMIASSLDMVFDLWKKRALFYMKKGAERNETLFLLLEKCIIFRAVTKSHTKPQLDIDLIVSDAAEYLAAEDLGGVALKYLHLTGSSKQSNVAFISDRIFNSDSTKSLQKQFSRPAFPY